MNSTGKAEFLSGFAKMETSFYSKNKLSNASHVILHEQQ